MCSLHALLRQQQLLYYQQIKDADINDGDNKVKAALIKYKNQGKYIEEILS